MTTTETAPLDLTAKLIDARKHAELIRIEFTEAETELAEALEREDYGAAESAKGRVSTIRPHLALAESRVTALNNAIEKMRAEDTAAQATAREQARRAAAEQAISAAVRDEQEAREEAERHMAAAMAGIGAVRASLMLAKNADETGRQARYAVATARSELDGTPMPPIIVPPNWAGSRIDRDDVLRAILRGH